MERETIAVHTRLKPGKEAEYDRIHRQIPAELDEAMRQIGVHNWRIWRSGRELFHLIEVDDYSRMRTFLAEHPANLPWQAQMSELLEIEDSYSGDDRGIPLVWGLPQR
ncbi:L-rhamnose mutarotase [Arthrobacter sp. TMN-50]